MYNTKDLHAVRHRAVEYDDPFETLNAKCPQLSKIRMFQSRMPSHFWPLCKQTECVAGGDQKAVTNLRSGVLREIERCVIEVRVGSWTKDVARIHRSPVFFTRSSSLRCFSCQ